MIRTVMLESVFTNKTKIKKGKKHKVVEKFVMF